MNFDYSYRSFLITCLFFGILYLTFKSISVSSLVTVSEKDFDVEYTSETLKPEIEDVASGAKTTSKVETNRAYNEAEKFISEIEKENAEYKEMSKPVQYSLPNYGSKNSEDRGIKKKGETSNNLDSMSNDLKSAKIFSEGNASKKNSSISFSLLDRRALNLPNPVYICPNTGKIVINIVVSESGKIVDVSYNKSASNSSNECLIDAALNYAKRANFTSLEGKNKQLGSITYNFQGQQ